MTQVQTIAASQALAARATKAGEEAQRYEYAGLRDKANRALGRAEGFRLASEYIFELGSADA